MVKIRCPKCKAKTVYLLASGKRRCARCRIAIPFQIIK